MKKNDILLRSLSTAMSGIMMLSIATMPVSAVDTSAQNILSAVQTFSDPAPGEEGSGSGEQGSGSGSGEQGSGSGEQGSGSGSGEQGSGSGEQGSGSGSGEQGSGSGEQGSGSGSGEQGSGSGEQGSGSQEPEAPSYPASFTKSVSVKSGTSASTVKNHVLSLLKSENGTLPISEITVTMDSTLSASGSFDGTVKYSDGQTSALTISVEVLEPTGWKFKNSLPNITAVNENNKSASALLRYVNSDMKLVASGSSDYEAALGSAPETTASTAFKWSDCNKEYSAAGGLTYTFTGTHDGSTITRTLTVSSFSYDLSLYIDYENSKVNTIKGMKWSINRNTDKSKWSSCSDDMTIPSTWLDRTVYFYMPETNYSPESSVTSLYIPPKADKPSEKLELTSTTHSITIENCWEFGDVEFSLDKENWITTSKDTKTWDGLNSNTSYTVYVRTRYDKGDYLASDAISSSIKTKAPIITEVEVSQKASGDTNVITAIASIEPQDSKTLSGSLSTNHFTKLNNTLKTSLSKYDDTDIHLIINHYPEDDEDYESNKTTFTMPLSAVSTAIRNGNMDIIYNTEFGSVTISNSELRDMSKSGTLTISMQKFTSSPSGGNWLRDQYKSGSPVYRCSIKVGSKAYEGTYEFPYELGRNVTVNGLSVYEVSTSSGNSKSSINFNYDPDKQAVCFEADADAYYVIVDDGYSVVTTLPFYDIPINFWAYKNILFCYNNGIMVGTTTTTFSPNSNVSKAQVVTMLARMGGADLTQKISKPHFKDITSETWYAAAAEWAYEKGICTGTSFNGDGPIQRQDIANLMYLYLTKVAGQSGKVDTKVTANFADQNKITSKNRTAALYMKQQGVMVGYGNNVFGPTDTVTRAQMAAVTQRLYSIQGIR